MRIFLGYHGGCLDGTISAYLLVNVFKDRNEMTVKPFARNEPIPVGYDQYIFADITPEQEQLKFMAGRRFLIIDHHGIDYEMPAGIEYIYSVGKCASMLIFEHFYRYFSHYPYLILLINKQDLGPLKNLTEMELNIYYYYEQFINKPELMHDIMYNPTPEIISMGNIIRQHIERQVSRIMKSGFTTMSFQPLNKPIHMYNTPILLNEIFSKDDFPLVGGYYTSGNMIMLNIRSLDDSALAVAKELGGGGHPSSAGARITIERFYQDFTFE